MTQISLDNINIPIKDFDTGFDIIKKHYNKGYEQPINDGNIYPIDMSESENITKFNLNDKEFDELIKNITQ
jgi:hypothetical protein